MTSCDTERQRQKHRKEHYFLTLKLCMYCIAKHSYYIISAFCFVRGRLTRGYFQTAGEVRVWTLSVTLVCFEAINRIIDVRSGDSP
jgi:hypothetical protein